MGNVSYLTYFLKQLYYKSPNLFIELPVSIQKIGLGLYGVAFPQDRTDSDTLHGLFQRCMLTAFI